MAINIIINAERINDEDKTIFFTVEIESKSFSWHADIPIDAEPIEYLRANKDKLHFLLLNKQYRDADWKAFKTGDNTELEAIQGWVASGHFNIIKVGEDEEGNDITEEQVIEKQEFKGTHPKWVKAEKLIDDIQNLDDIKAFLKKIVRYIT